MNTVLKPFGLRSIGTLRAHLRLILKVAFVLSASTAAYAWTLLHLQGILFANLNSCSTFFPNSTQQCLDQLYDRTVRISVATITLILVLTFCSLLWLVHQFVTINCRQLHTHQPADGIVPRQLLTMCQVVAATNAIVLLVVAMP